MSIADKAEGPGCVAEGAQGADVPFVLRPVAAAGGREPTSSRWTISAECYVRTVMYGEAWSESRCHAFHVV